MKSVTIVGASGFIGSNLTKKFLDLDWHVTTYSTKITNSANVTSKIVDWENPEFGEIPTTDCVIYAAAQVNNATLQRDPERFLSQGMVVTQNLVEGFKNMESHPHFIYLSTTSLYGAEEETLVDETFPTKNNSIYDSLKIKQEEYLQELASEGVFSGLSILRLSNIFGRTVPNLNGERGFLEKTILKMLEGEKIFCYGDGKYLRDYLDISDLVEIISIIADSSLRTENEVINVGSGISMYLIDALEHVAAEVSKVIEKEPIIEFSPLPAGSSPSDFRNYRIDISKLSSLTNWNPKRDFETNIKSYIKKIAETL